MTCIVFFDLLLEHAGFGCFDSCNFIYGRLGGILSVGQFSIQHLSWFLELNPHVMLAQTGHIAPAREMSFFVDYFQDSCYIRGARRLFVLH